MIAIKNLNKSYGSKKALKNISFTIEEGEVVGFLGPNGAGKSTAMNIITGYLSSNSGDVLVDGLDILSSPLEVKKKIGYLPEQPPLYLEMTVDDYLNFVYDLKKIKLDRQKHISDICETVKITGVRKRVIKHLSKGYRQRVGLAQALVGDPPILILDEPTVGLDPNQIIEVRNVIQELGKAHTIIFSTHILSEISEVCKRIIVIDNGEIIADNSPENLSKELKKNNVITARVVGNKGDILNSINSVIGVTSVEVKDTTEAGAYDYVITSQNDVDVRKDLFYELAAKSFPVLQMNVQSMSLENIFITLTSDEQSAKEQAKAQEGTEEQEIEEETVFFAKGYAQEKENAGKQSSDEDIVLGEKEGDE